MARFTIKTVIRSAMLVQTKTLKKTRIQETPNLSTDADSSTNILFPLARGGGTMVDDRLQLK